MNLHSISRMLLPVAVSVLCLTGCTVETRSGPAYAPPPPPPAQNEVVYEGEPPPPPPPPQEAAPPPPPGNDDVWVKGYQRWNGHGYVSANGHYERRPHANARWIDAHWETRGRQHVWVEGRWG